MRRIDYDKIAHLYDDPVRDHPLDEELVVFFREHPSLDPHRACVLDIGCGTGTQLAADRAVYGDMFAVGVDPSLGMLHIAHGRDPQVCWVQGGGEALPFRSRSFDYVCTQFCYHHIANKVAFIQEAFRVLTSQGRFVLWNLDPWSMDGWILYRFFPSARLLDRNDFLPTIALVDLLRTAGFATIRTEKNYLLSREDIRQFQTRAARRHHISQLMAISDEEYAQGLRQIDASIARGNPTGWTLDSETCLVRLVADKPDGHGSFP
ncbi:MAG: methyltransferase domain-containing protein [Chloroflexi bacterium]|nr:methyltransferase domain-containing protein [Chloroflexota bacterium]